METELLLATDSSLKDEILSICKNGSCNSPRNEEAITEPTSTHTAKSRSDDNLNDTSHTEYRQLLCKSLENIDNNSQINQRLLNEKKCLSRSSSFVSEMKDVTITIGSSKPEPTSPKNTSPNTRIFSTNRFAIQSIHI